MFGKQIGDLTIEDIKQLIKVTKEPEGQFVDYKTTLETTDDAKKELVKDISAFANAQGGYLIVGVEEIDGIPKRICGTTKLVGRQSIEEWISGVVSANTDPKVSYEIKSIKYTTEKVVLVIYIKSSRQKPHMVTMNRRNSYFRRHLDISSAATNQEVRDMFAESQASVDVLNSFLSSRNILDNGSKDFALTNNSKRLKNNFLKQDFAPIFVISITPKLLNEINIDPATGRLREWINTHTKGYAPIPHADLFQTHENEIDINGITFPEILYKDGVAIGFRRYVEFTNNGYIEAGYSTDIFTNVGTTEEGKLARIMHLTNAVALSHALINLANIYYPQIEYSDQVYVQLSLKNILNFAVSGFDDRGRNGGGGWAPAFSIWYTNPPLVQNYNQFKIIEVFKPTGKNESDVSDLIYSLANKLSRAFGVDIVKCFDDKKTYNPALLNHIR